jgi:hypothetical protein
LTLARCKKEGVSLDNLANLVAGKLDLDARQILLSSKRTLQTEARMVFCFLARQLGFPSIETGKYLGIGQAAVSCAARKGELLSQKHDIFWK